VSVDFVHEFVEIVFVSRAEVDEGLDGLVGIGGDVLFAAFFDDLFNVSFMPILREGGDGGKRGE
jgi:hypothetical protein